MLAFATQPPILCSGEGSCNSTFGAQWAALVAITCASLNLANAAGFDEIGAFNIMRPNALGSIIVNESRPKNFVVGSTNTAIGINVASAIDAAESSVCTEKKQPLCRDLAKSEFQLTSLHFMLPEVRGLSPKSLNIRRNSVSATYTFR